MTTDTPRMPVAASRFKKLFDKLGPTTAGVLKKVAEAVVALRRNQSAYESDLSADLYGVRVQGSYVGVALEIIKVERQDLTW